MNDKDKEAFKAWYLGMNCYEEISRDAWQAALEYKMPIIQSEALLNTSLFRENQKLQAENKKLREALQEIKGYGYATCDSDGEQIYNIAKEALKEVKE